jgi:Protein kinase domain/Lectin C-type domain
MSDSPFSAPSLETMSSLLPGFEFTTNVSANAHGAVYFATQKSLDRAVAIKLLSPGLASNGLIESKSRAAAALKHPNLIAVFDSGSVAGMPYLVMEFVPGKSLARSTKGSMIEFGQAMMIIDGICEGLAYAHDNRLFHGHINPTNILLNQKAEPKIGNFGLPHSTHGDPADPTSLCHTAPEVLANSAAATSRSDVYSIATVFYQLITGQEHGPDAPPPSAVCKCKPEVDEVLKRATDPDPAQRMADVRSFQSALKQAASGGGKVKLQAAEKAPAPATAVTGEPADMGAKVRSGKVGFDWKLVRNLAIIVGLLYGIHLTWQLLGTVRANRERENREILAKQAADKEIAIAAAAQKQADDLAKLQVRPDTPPVMPDEPEETIDPMDSLEELRPSLVSGSRSEMPVGSVTKGESHYFFVPDAMTWADAMWFAEDHGGHLAVPDADADPAWLTAEVSKDNAAWLGIARAGNSWMQADGNAWNPDKPPAGIGQHISLDKGGFVAADGSVLKRTFIIQWHSDGSNPGKLASLLAATAKSLGQATPLFPPGTIASGSRHFLYVSRPIKWKEAQSLAESAGGNLLVVSDAEEAASLNSMTGRLKSDSRIWLGGLIDGSLWTWVTGEPWKAAVWASDATVTDENSALCIRAGSGWDGMDREDEASGFIIEWSEDAKSNGSGEVQTGASGDSATGLLARAKEVVLAAEKKRSEALAANVKKLGWDLDAFVRNLNRSTQAEWIPHVERVKACVDGNRLQVEALRSDEISYSTEMLKLTTYHVDKQAEIDKQFTASATAIRDAFVSKLNDFKAKAQAAGQPKLVEDTEESIEAAGDLDSWLESFGIEDVPAAANE